MACIFVRGGVPIGGCPWFGGDHYWRGPHNFRMYDWRLSQIGTHGFGSGSQLVWTGDSFHLLKNVFYFPLLVLKGIYHYWKYVFIFSGGRIQMEDS